MDQSLSVSQTRLNTMVGATPQPQPPPPPQAQAQLQEAQPSIPSAEEEALKRNTDCVYFLASPLTCKKGSECEYRHSDIARVNPRDCWYWINGNCLNPKCGFRHPPLDGLMGTPVPTHMGSSLLPAHSTATPATPATHPPYISGKQGVPCIFFQKRLCLKGDKCPFLHAPNSVSIKAPQVPAATPVTEPPSLKKAFGGLEKCTQDWKVQQINVPQSDKTSHPAKPLAIVETGPTKNGVASEKKTQSSGMDFELPRYRTTNVNPATNGNPVSGFKRVHQDQVSDDHSVLNGNDPDEFSREPSPGFDVLVDDELRDSDYYGDEDKFGRTRDHEDKNFNPRYEYEIGHSADYCSMDDVDRDMYHDPRGYHSNELMQRQRAWEQRRASSERMSAGSAHPARGQYPRHESPDQIDKLDLRHQLSKHRRVNGLRSVISHDYPRENHVEDQSYRGPQRDTHHLPPHESLRSRLRGRIKMPGRSSSPLNGNDLRSEREMGRGRNRGRLSPGRPQISSHQVRERIKGRVEDDFNNEGRNFGGLRIKRDIITDTNTDFTGPKSLAELKIGDYAENNEQHTNDQQSLRKRKFPKLEGHQHSDSHLSFEGPKPLSEILKRKKGAETTISGISMTSGNGVNNNQMGVKQGLIRTTVIPGVKGVLSSKPIDETDLPDNSNNEVFKSASGEIGVEGKEKVKSADSKFSLQHNVSEPETEEGMIVDEAKEDHDLDVYDPRDGDSDYEQIDGEGYNIDEGDNADSEDQYFDDEDGDDFAKKMGVVYS